MSSGQKAWAEDCAAEALAEHRKRLEAIGYGNIAEIATEIVETLRLLERDMVALPRVGWSRIDHLNRLAKKLG